MDRLYFVYSLVVYSLALVSAAGRDDKQFSIFNVIKFPNEVCASTSSLNGTCYTNTECTSLGGSSSGSCASGFGVCCVFSIACGATTSQNNTYAAITSFNTATDADPCLYTYCKNNDDVCKLRIDYDTMVLSPPESSATTTTTTSWLYGLNYGHCLTDTLTVGVPGYSPPPIVCGYITGQHMWVPASDSCVTVTLDIDTATTATTRKWNIKVTQYECGNLMAPERNCLQYHTAQTGSFASFNWDTSSTSNVRTDMAAYYHLANQYYDICIRRARSYCSICFSPEIILSPGIATTGYSYGISAGSVPAPGLTSATASVCTGATTVGATDTAALGHGDYLNIDNLQDPATLAAIAIGVDKICGLVWNAIAGNAGTAAATACTYKTPFRVGVHFDASEALAIAPQQAGGDNFSAVENVVSAPSTTGAGIGTQGFYLAYWQVSC